jgi:predicted DNA-binding ribbon-helix-helix protein
MRSPTAVRQSIRLGGRTTTVTLENAFWLGLKEIARRRRINVSDLLREIGAKRQHSNFSSELRLFVLEFYRKQASLPTRELLRERVSLNLKATRFERREVIARPPLGRRTGDGPALAFPINGAER